MAFGADHRLPCRSPAVYPDAWHGHHQQPDAHDVGCRLVYMGARAKMAGMWSTLILVPLMVIVVARLVCQVHYI